MPSIVFESLEPTRQQQRTPISNQLEIARKQINVFTRGSRTPRFLSHHSLLPTTITCLLHWFISFHLPLLLVASRLQLLLRRGCFFPTTFLPCNWASGYAEGIYPVMWSVILYYALSPGCSSFPFRLRQHLPALSQSPILHWSYLWCSSTDFSSVQGRIKELGKDS